ncbi:MAG: hypothetical protein IMF07_04535 [Proteobacteria bacterium]|nr:hypothetical protein [Pseudomonadota bacterium]
MKRNVALFLAVAGIILSGSVDLQAGEFSGYSNDELIQRQSERQNMNEEGRKAFREEVQRRMKEMSEKERLQFLKEMGVDVSRPEKGKGSDRVSARSTELDKVMGDLKGRLSLAENQTLEVRKIIKAYLDKKQTLMEEAKGQDQSAKRKLRSEMQKLREDTEKRLAKTLTSEQLEKYRKYEEEQRETMKSERGSKGGTRSGAGKGGHGGGMGRRGGGMGW